MVRFLKKLVKGCMCIVDVHVDVEDMTTVTTQGETLYMSYCPTCGDVWIDTTIKHKGDFKHVRT